MQRISIVLLLFLAGIVPVVRAQVGVLHPAASRRVTLYEPDLAWVEETRAVRLIEGMNTVRLDFTRGNIDLDSVFIAPVGHPGEVTLKSEKRLGERPMTLYLEFESAREGLEAFRIAYTIRGISARIRYVLVYDEAGSGLELSQHTDVDNRTGEDYASTEARVVLGKVNTVQGGPTFGRSATAEGEAPPPVKEALMQGFSEHQLLALPAPADYLNGELKSIVSMRAVQADVPIKYEYSVRRDAVRVWRILESKNTKESGLEGAALPPGPWHLYLKETPGSLRYLRSGSIDFIPPGKEIKIEMGPDPGMVVERKQMDYRKIELKFGEYNRQLISYGTEESYEIEIRNHNGSEAEVKMLEPIDGTQKWEIPESSHPYQKKDAHTIEFLVKVPSAEKLKVSYRVTKHEMTR